MAQKLQITFRGKLLGEISPGDVDMDEAQRLEDTAGMTYNEMVEGYGRSSAKATRALVWFMRLRSGETAELWENFKFSDVDSKVVGDVDPTEAAPGGKTGPSNRNGSETDGSEHSPS